MTLSLADVEHGHIVQVLEAVDWNKREAARMLCIARGTLYRKIKDYGINRPLPHERLTASALGERMPTTPNASLDNLIGLAECATLLGLAQRTISTYAASGALPSVLVAGRRLYDRVAVLAWRNARESQRAAIQQIRAATRPDASQ